MKQVINIRKEHSDIYEIAKLLNDCWKTAYAGILTTEYLDCLSDGKRASALQKWYDDGWIEFLCLRKDGVLVGVCGYGKSITEDYPNDGEIHSIYLLSEYIGKRYGHVLLSKAEKLLVDKGYMNLIVNTFTTNTRALSFYADHGYTAVKESTIKFGNADYPFRILRKSVVIV